MPKFARPNSYNGRQSTQQWTGDTRGATLPEVIAGKSTQLYISPQTLSAAIGALLPAASTTVAGVAEIATQAEVNTGTDNTRIVSPLTLATRFASPPAIGNTTPASGAFTTLTATSTITAGTTLTATLGNITATNGNIVRNTAGNKDIYTSVASTTAAGANSAGTVTLVGGTATIATTAVTANSQIRIYRQGIGATGAAALGILSIGTKTAGVSFVINAVTAAAANANQATDVSIVAWEIVN